jgi:choice-of-anchor B domain-containing protein
MKLSLNIFLSFLFLVVACADNPTKTESCEEPCLDKLKCSDSLSDGTYSCNSIDLLAHIPARDLLAEPTNNGKVLNDIWGWIDPQTGIEYALVGLNDGVAFVDISTPSKPVVVAKLNETASASRSVGNNSRNKTISDEEKSPWRDFKTYKNHLYVVSDGQSHGLQIFDLTRLREIDDPPAIFSEDELYEDFENAHNIAINTETGFAYVVGSDTYGGGLHIIDVHDPINPKFAGFHSDSTVGLDSTGYVHDTQCVNYRGPDADYQDDEICMNSSETHLLIANVTDKENMATISKATYEGNAYAHQGWLTEDHRYFLLDDEADEQHGANTRTYIWDVRDLDNPQIIGVHESKLGSIDHNQYVKGDYVYQANYTSGLRILSLDKVGNGELEEVAHFDTYPLNNRAEFNGAWSNYPYFESGVVVVSDISNGLFIVKPKLD